jgi:uncharacterized protein YrrD
MQFKEGVDVFTADGKRVGKIDRVVIEPDSWEVTHLVVKKGFLFTSDKVVPMSLVGPATEEKVTLRQDSGSLEEMPDFQESHYVLVDRGPETTPAPGRQARSVFWYPPLGGLWPEHMYHRTRKAPRFVLRTEQNIPANAVALEEGAKVRGSDGKQIGSVERLFTDEPQDRVTHLLISKGLLIKEKKLIPSDWISKVMEEEVYLSVSSEFVDGLPEYQVQDE